MAYFNYHARVMQKIKAGELTSYHFDANYKNIGYALVLCFQDKSYPIREEKFADYFSLIGDLYYIKKEKACCVTKFKR